MIIARSRTGTGKELLILGLSRANIERMTSGKPVHVKEATHGEGIPDGWEIVIMFGETEQEMQKQFVEAGMIGPETKVNIDPRLAS